MFHSIHSIKKYSCSQFMGLHSSGGGTLLYSAYALKGILVMWALEISNKF